MKKALSIAWIVGSVLIVVLIIKLITKSSENTDIAYVDVSEFIATQQGKAETLYEKLAPIGFNEASHQEALALRKLGWYVLTTSEGNLTYWNSNKIGFDSSILNNPRQTFLYRFGDDLYTVCAPNKDTYFAFRLANDGQLHQELTAYNDLFEDKELAKGKLTQTQKTTRLPLQTKKRTQRAFFNIALLASFLFLMLSLWYTKLRSRSLYVAGTAVILANILTYLYSNISLDDYFLTATQSIQTKSILQLNAILYIHLASLVASCLIVFSAVKKLPAALRAFLLSLGTLFLADFFLDLNQHIVLRSAIPFNFEKLFNLSSTSFAALGFICLSLIALWILVYYTKLNLLITTKDGVAVVIGIISFSLFQHLDAGRSFLSLCPPIALVGLCIFINALRIRPRWAIYIYFVLTAVLAASIVTSNHEKRNEEIAHAYATQLVTNEDTRAETMLRSFENQLALDFLVPADYENFLAKKEIIESRLKHLYFSNYLEKYELKLLSFGPDGRNINGSSLYTYAYLDSIFNNHSTRTSSAYFYRLNNTSDLSGYIAEYENCDIDGHYGSTYILLQPRVVQSDFLYPEVFKNQEDKSLISLNDYSFGIYFRKQLMSQRGSFSYRLNELPVNNNSLFALSELHHYTYRLGEYNVVLSKRENRARAWLSTLTFTIVTLLLLGIICSLAAYFFLSKDHPLARAFLPFANRYLSTRIQTSLTIILLTGLLLSVYIIIGFIQANYNQNLEDQLLNKVKRISATLQNKVNLSTKLQNEEQRTLILNEESSTYNVDINLYSMDGYLLSSTKPYLTREQILGRQMNPKAYVKLTQEKASQLLIQEELEGSDYLSAYIPLFDGKNNVLGYVNTPFFGRNEELNKQISNLVVNILNIYFLLLLGGVVLAYIISRQISKPLLLIREKIAKTELRGQNELITYTRDDEIGQLIKQYNKMVLELEESANQMAETEREGAWREMAKQVAHEIKNPLTPMKLSLQHLQRAYSQGPSEKLDILFAKTSKLIVEQIESLSAMASEFGNFAKMPEDKFEQFDIAATLRGTVDLFKRSENADIVAEIEEHASVHADPEQMRRVFNNLIKNAIQAIPENQEGNIHVSLKTTDQQVLIAVRDNGKGIPKENYTKVFVPNFSTKNSGMGLGLAICRKIVEQAKGTIRFESKVNRGTTFFVTLPVDETA